MKSVALSALLLILGVAACTKPATKRHAYTCPDGYEFTIAYSDQGDAGDIAKLEDTSGVRALPRAPAASGERYTNESTAFRSQDDEAAILKNGETVHGNCTTGSERVAG